jgi:hypothetical protein
MCASAGVPKGGVVVFLYLSATGIGKCKHQEIGRKRQVTRKDTHLNVSGKKI